MLCKIRSFFIYISGFALKPDCTTLLANSNNQNYNIFVCTTQKTVNLYDTQKFPFLSNLASIGDSANKTESRETDQYKFRTELKRF